MLEDLERRSSPAPLEPPTSVGRVVIDLDGVLAEKNWPSPGIGTPIEQGLQYIRRYAASGFEVVVYTARPASHAPLIERWLKAVGVGHLVYDIICDKPVADLYIDDRAWRPPYCD